MTPQRQQWSSLFDKYKIEPESFPARFLTGMQRIRRDRRVSSGAQTTSELARVHYLRKKYAPGS